MFNDQFTIAGVRVILLVTLIILFIQTAVYFDKHKPLPHKPVTTIDTISPKVNFLQDQVNKLTMEREALKAENASIINKYHAILLRIASNPSDSAQYQFLKELLNKSKPNPIDVNQSIAQGQLCCALYANESDQLRNCDSVSNLKDSVISIQKTEIALVQKNSDIISQENAIGSMELTVTQSKLRKWRIASVTQFSAIAAALTIFILTH